MTHAAWAMHAHSTSLLRIQRAWAMRIFNVPKGQFYGKDCIVKHMQLLQQFPPTAASCRDHAPCSREQTPPSSVGTFVHLP